MNKNTMIKSMFLSVMLLLSVASWAELPSWGMTEEQYKSPTFVNKMSEIGSQSYKNNWLLKVTAPNDWHTTIRNALTKNGERDVQLTFKDSVYQSISISAVPGAKIAQISPSTSNGSTVQKQVVIEKPEIDTAVDAPDFGDTSFNNNDTGDLLGDIGSMDIALPKAQVKNVEPISQATQKPRAVEPTTAPAPATKTVVSANIDNEAIVEEIKENLRVRHARSKRVEKSINYSNITSRDELFIEAPVVLVKRFINQGVVLYFWMRESYDPSIHKLVEKGSGKFQKDPVAEQGVTVVEADVAEEVVEQNQPTDLNFTAVDTVVEDQDDLRRDYIRSKRVEYSITADKLKTDDILYVKNQTVLVERPIASTQSVYFWLIGDTVISQEVERKGDNTFLIK